MIVGFFLIHDGLEDKIKDKTSDFIVKHLFISNRIKKGQMDKNSPIEKWRAPYAPSAAHPESLRCLNPLARSLRHQRRPPGVVALSSLKSDMRDQVEQ